MSTIKRILIAIDAETNECIAIQKGLALASAHRAEVFVFAVLKDFDVLAASFSEMISKEEFHQNLINYYNLQITKLVNDNNPHNIDVSVELVTGIPYIEIIRKAFSINADIILHSSKQEEQGRLFFSSSDWRLIRKSPIPVWIIKNKQHHIPKQIMAAIDVMDSSATKSLNKNILELAAEITYYSSSHLTVFSAWDLLGEEMLRHSPFLSTTQRQLDNALMNVSTAVQEKHNELKLWLSKNTKLDGKKITWLLEKGDARKLIPTFVNDHNIGLLIMGTVNRTGISGLLIGNTAETILSKIQCSVITMKPPMFKSPVIS